MPKIDFYILPESSLQSCLQWVCRLIEKAYKQRHRVYIHTENKQLAHQLDEMLWTYRDDSFLPHNLLGEGPEPPPPIQIGFDQLPEKHRDIMINLSQEIPAFYRQFSRILEPVRDAPEAQQAGRERYRTYRSQGFDIQTHKLQTIEL